MQTMRAAGAPTLETSCTRQLIKSALASPRVAAAHICRRSHEYQRREQNVRTRTTQTGSLYNTVRANTPTTSSCGGPQRSP